MKRALGALGALFGLALVVLVLGSVAGATSKSYTDSEGVTKDLAQQLARGGDDVPDDVSGTLDFKGVDFGNGLSTCPQAGKTTTPKPLQDLTPDPLSQRANATHNVRVSQDYSCMPQDETSIAINPIAQNNIIGGANDYRNGFGSSGFYASTDNGQTWYDGVKPFPGGTPNGNDHLDGGGDPAIAFDSQGTAYYADIHFDRTDLTNGVFVARSTNGGFTWSKPCIAQGRGTVTDQNAVCGGNGDPRIPNDGTVAFFQDDRTGLTPTTDKEYITTGPRPAGVTATCFAPVSKTPIPAGQPGCSNDVIGPDRIYVTYSLFDTGGCRTATGPGQHCSVNIYESYSDDRAHSFSPPHLVSGSTSFCLGIFGDNSCDDNQDSVPTVNPTTGELWVGYESFNTQDENMYVVSRSTDGGQTFQGPFFVTNIFDVNYPTSSGNPNPAAGNRPDCGARGQGDFRHVLTNSCFRVVSWANVVADKRGGAFANTLYAVISDNRNGQMVSSNTDIFLFKSNDGGLTWLGPTRVNDDPSRQPTIAEGTRDCGRIVGRVCPTTALNFGNDQWFPWIDISPTGKLFAVWEDRRLDTTTTASEWPGSRQRTGNYLVWFWGGTCQVSTPLSRDCVAPEAGTITQPTSPAQINPPSGAVIPGGNQQTFPFRNIQLQDVPNNWDYTFRAGIFAGDYSGVAAGQNEQAWTIWTDSRNGRSSRNELGRNPACEQSDIFGNQFSSGSSNGNNGSQGDLNDWAVTPCPTASVDSDTRSGNGTFHK